MGRCNSIYSSLSIESGTYGSNGSIRFCDAAESRYLGAVEGRAVVERDRASTRARSWTGSLCVPGCFPKSRSPVENR